MTTPQPPHPMHALTSGELAGYRRQLEHAINGIDPAAPVQALLHRNLEEVLAEQDSRAALTATAGRAAPAPATPARAATPDEPATRHLTAIADRFTVGGIACQPRRDGSTPSLSIEDPAAGPDGPAAAPRDDLTPRVFHALYGAFDLHTVGGTHIAVPKGTPCFAAPSLSEVARKISAREHSEPAAPPAIPPGPLDRRPAR